jgi:signal recognition particle GTPase
MQGQEHLVAAGAAAALAVIAMLVVLLVVRRRRRAAAAAGPAATSWTSGLARTRGSLARRLFDAWGAGKDRDGWLLQVEEILLGSDVGVKATQALLARLGPAIRNVQDADALRAVVRDSVRDLLAAPSSEVPAAKPEVIVGVGADIVKHQHGADPSAVTFDGVQAAQARGADVVIVDTAGRLHVKANLMEEVKKIARTTAKLVPGAPHQVLLVIDATSGQNALAQARIFNETLGITGVVLTKLDGTARGGVALAIRNELGLPIRYVGLGEQAADLAPFDAEAFAGALFSEREESADVA